MVKSCVAAGCAKTSNDGISFFKFPSDPIMRQRWTREVQRTRDRWNGPSQHSVLCASHFTADCFEHDSAIAATMGINKRQRLKPDAIPTIFERQAPQHPGAHGSTGGGSRESRKRSAATTAPETTRTSGTAQVKKPRQAYVKRERSRIVQEILSAPPSQSMADDTSTDPVSMTTESAFTTGEMGSDVEHIDVGVQISPSKKNARVQTRRRCFSVGVQVSADIKTKDAAVQCSLPYTHTEPITKDASVQCRRHPLLTSSPVHERCNYPSDPELLDMEGHDHTVDTSGFTFSPGSTSSSCNSPISEAAAAYFPTSSQTTYLVFESALLMLFVTCRFCASASTNVKKAITGSFLRITQFCAACKQTWCWESQPYVGDIPAGNIYTSAAILYTGAFPAKTLRIFRILNCATITCKTFFRHQSNILQPAIQLTWERNQLSLFQRMKAQQRNLVLSGDGRADSPGHSAKYGSYTVIDMSCNKVMDFKLVQSNEVGGSYHMEKEGLERVLEFLQQQQQLQVDVLVTDRHRQINKWLRENHPEIMHYYDVWHVAKGFRKKLEAMAKQKDCELIAQWQRSIVNHMYWCVASTPSGNGEMIKAKWLSLENHIHGVHTGPGDIFPECAHSQLDAHTRKKWFKRHTKSSEKLTTLLTNNLLCKDLMRLSPHHQMSSLEAFHSVVIHFAPKYVPLSYLGMQCRLQLAALHFNENSSRDQALTKEGKERYNILFPKFKKGGYIVRKVTVEPTYNYLDELMKETIRMCEEGTPQPSSNIPEPLCSGCERPDMATASGASVLPTLTTPHRHHHHHHTPHGKLRQLPPQATVEDVVTEIFRVFVDAIPHVPDHRRLPLLFHLLGRVGPSQYLSVALGLLVSKHVQQLGVKEQTPTEALLSTSFPVSLAQLFSVDHQLQSVAQLLTYTASLPLEKPHTASAVRQLPSSVNQIFNVATHSPKQLQQFKYSCVSLLATLLFHRRLAEQLSCLETDSLQTVEETVHSILQGAINYETVVANHSNHKPSKKDSSHKFILSLVNKLNDIIGHVTSLLSPGSLVAMVMHLLHVGGAEVQGKALKITASKLEEGKRYFSPDQDGCLVELLSIVVGVAKDDSTYLLTRHSAIYCVKLLARRLTNKYHPQLTQALQDMLSLLSSSASLSAELTGSCLLAVAELSSSLGPQLIPLLPAALPPVLQRVGGGGGVMVQISAVTALGVIVQTLPKFLSSYAAEIVEKLCHFSEEAAGGGGGKERVQLTSEASQTREKVATLVPPRTLIPVYTKCYPLLCPLGKGSLLALLDMVGLTVGSLTQDDTRNLSHQLGELFMTCLDHRTQQKEESMDDVAVVEEECVQAFTELVVQLSETLFRPMFLKLLDWATHRGADEDRLITFFHLADGVAGRLKGLFLLFAGHIVKSAASLLEKTNCKDKECPLFYEDPLGAEKTCCLLSHLLCCLHKCFLHNQAAPTTSFLTRERFDTLMPPLVHQVSNVVGGGKLFQHRVETNLQPCLAQLAVAAGKEEMWKPLNHQLLLKTRHKAAEVRYAAVMVLKEMCSKLGNEFMQLLPETIPFLAELLEDESEEVEQETQSLISTIETELGESIQQYFQ